jgi:hypothetical protein
MGENTIFPGILAYSPGKQLFSLENGLKNAIFDYFFSVDNLCEKLTQKKSRDF